MNFFWGFLCNVYVNEKIIKKIEGNFMKKSEIFKKRISENINFNVRY